MGQDFTGYDFDGFNDGEPMPVPQDDPFLQWFHPRQALVIDPATGEVAKVAGRGGRLTNREETTSGWHMEAHRWPAMDALMERGGYPIMSVTQGSRQNAYWQLTSATMFVLARGLYSEDEMRDPTKRAGIAFGWMRDPDGGRWIKVMKFKCILADLLPYYQEGEEIAPILVTVKGKINVNTLLRAFGQEGQYRVLAANNAILKQRGASSQGKTPTTPFWGFSITLEPGEREQALNKEQSQGAAVAQILPSIPERPQSITPEYLAAHHCGNLRHVIFPLIADAVQWSLDASRQIGESDERKQDAAPTEADEAAPEASQPSARPSAHPTQKTEPAQPTAQPVSLKLMSLADLSKIQGTALPGQRMGLQQYGDLALAQQKGLTKEEAGRAIKAANAKNANRATA